MRSVRSPQGQPRYGLRNAAIWRRDGRAANLMRFCRGSLPYRQIFSVPRPHAARDHSFTGPFWLRPQGSIHVSQIAVCRSMPDRGRRACEYVKCADGNLRRLRHAAVTGRRRPPRFMCVSQANAGNDAVTPASRAQTPGRHAILVIDYKNLPPSTSKTAVCEQLALQYPAFLST